MPASKSKIIPLNLSLVGLKVLGAVKVWWGGRTKAVHSRNFTQFFAIVFGTMTFVVGSYLTITGIIIPKIRALNESTYVMPTDLAFNASGYASGSGVVAVMSSEVRIATSSSWMNGAYLAKKTITVNNLSGQTLPASGSAQIAVNTKELYDAGKLQSDCDDLRIAHIATMSGNVRLEIPISIQVASGATDCSDSVATIITFPRQEILWASQNSSNYEMYYSNSAASAPGSNGGVVSGVKTPTLWCPFAGSTVCMDSETPSTETGSVRYGGGKSALSFDGKNDRVSFSSTGFQFSDSTTIEMWFYHENYDVGTQTLMSRRYQGNDGFWWVYLNSGAVNLQYSINGSYAHVSGPVITDEAWHHLAIVYSAGVGVDFFLDGVKTHVNNTNQFLSHDSSQTISIGAYTNGSLPFIGLIDELRVSNIARYSDNFTVPDSSFVTDSYTELLYHFDENGDDPRNSGKVIDASGNGNHGTISGAKYVSGLVGVDGSASVTGAVNSGSYASHQGVFIEEDTTNLIQNPSFENAVFNSVWGSSAYTYATASATFTAGMAKRNSGGPFYAGPFIQGNWDASGTPDLISASVGTKIGSKFYPNFDADQGSVVFWITPEWNGNDGRVYSLYQFGYNGRWNLTKTASGYLQLSDGNGNTKVTVNIADWTAGSTYNLVIRWDLKNTIDGTNYMSLSINDVHNFSGTTISDYELYQLRFGYSDSTGGLTSGVNAIIEGFTIYRRVLFDGTYGRNVGNGDELNQIYNSGTGKDPTLITGSWDVVFALPTNSSTGSLSTGTGNAWSMPHTSNLLGGTNGKNGFMMDGTYTNDGLTSYSPNKLYGGVFNRDVDLGQWTATPSYDLRDEFIDTVTAGSVNGTYATDGVNVRSVTDTQSQVSVGSGKLTFSDGHSNYNDPKITYPSLPRSVGKVISGKFNVDTYDVNQHAYIQAWSSSWLQSATWWLGNSNGLGGVVPGTSDIRYANVAKSTGSYWFTKTDNNAWLLQWINPSGTGNASPAISNFSTSMSFDYMNSPVSTWLPTPIAYDTFTRSDGAVGSSETTGPDGQSTSSLVWTGGAISGGKMVITPTTGSELLTNGTFDSDTAWNKESGWTISGGVAHATGVTTGRLMTSNSPVQNDSKFYQARWDVLNYSQGASRAALYDSIPMKYFVGNGTNTSVVRSKGSGIFHLDASGGPATYDVDNVSLKTINMDSALATVNTSTADVVETVNIDWDQNNSAGLVVNLDSSSNPQNYVLVYLVYHNSARKLYLDKFVAGVATNLILTDITYVAGAPLTVIKDGTKYRVYYNNAMVGSEQTISDPGVISNTRHGIFSTNSGISFDNFTIFPRGTGGEYTGIPAEELTPSIDTTVKYSGAGSVKLVAPGNDANFTQSTNVGNTSTYTLTAYAYTTGSAVTSADLELWYDSSVLSTTYTSVGSGWYRLTGSVSGVASTKSYGVRVKANKTVYVDDISLLIDSSNTSISALATNQKIYGGGYGVTSDQWGGMYRDITVTAGQDLVVRGIAHSDGSGQPRLVLYDVNNQADIGSLNGTTTSTASAPDTILFTGEAPSGCTTVRVYMTNASGGSTGVSWHQVEVYANKVNNPSLEGGSGDPFVPTNWQSGGLDASDTLEETSIVHSGSKSILMNTSVVQGEDIRGNGSTTAGKFNMFGGFLYSTVSEAKIQFGVISASYASQNGGYWEPAQHPTVGSSWTHTTLVTRAINSSGATYAVIANNGATGIRYADDLYGVSLDDVSLTVTPASSANSTEASGIRVDGGDVLSQTITGMTTTQGTIKFRFTPRHSFSSASSFGITYPEIISVYAGASDYIFLEKRDSQIKLGGKFNGTDVNAYWSSPTLNAGTTYAIEIGYKTGATMYLKVDGVEMASVNMGANSFSTAPTTAYFGSWLSQLGYHYDGTFSSYSNSAVTEITANPYFKFGSKSAKIVGQDSPDEYVTAVTTTSNARNTISAYVYDGTSANLGGTVDAAVATIASGSASLSTTYTDMGGGWWRLSYTDSANIPAGTYNWGVQVKAGKTIYVDGVQAENKAYPTTYADGSLGTGYAWTGTANASTSTRTVPVLKYPVTEASSSSGTVGIWVKPNYTDTDSNIRRTYVSVGYYYMNNNILLRKKEGSLGYRMEFGNQITSGYSTPTKDAWAFLVATWSNGTAKFYLNGEYKQTLTGSTGDLLDSIRVGKANDGGGDLGANATLSDLRIFDTDLTDSEVADLYYQGLSSHSESTESDDRYDSGTKTYTSPVIDLLANGAWGTTAWTSTQMLSGGTVSYFTRSSSDNVSWSDWSAVSGSTIASDPRRYLQWKADLAVGAEQSTSPVITGLTIAYVEDSSAPENPSETALGYSTNATASADMTSGSWYNFATPKFVWDAAVDSEVNGQSASGVNGYHVLLTTDSSATPSANVSDDCYSYVSAPSTTVVVGSGDLASCNLSDGVYYLRLQSKDNSENVSNPVSLFTYRYDGSLPLAPTSVSSTTPGYSATNLFTFYWPTATDQGPSAIRGYEYKTGAPGAEWAYTTSTQVENIQAYQEGQNFFYVRSQDYAGNYSGSTSNLVAASSFYYNASAPTAPLDIVFTPESTEENPSESNVFSVSWSKPASYSGEIAKYYYCVNCTPSLLTMTETTPAETVNRALSNMSLATQQGRNTFYIVAEDNNVNSETGKGNVNFGSYATADFFASTIAPGAPSALTVSDASDRDSNTWRLTLAWKVPETGGTPAKYDVYRSPDNSVFTKMGSTTSTAYTDADLDQSTIYYYKVAAIDNAGASSIFSNVVNMSAEGKYSTPPMTGGVPAVTAGSSTAIVSWSTSRAAFGSVEYGKTSEYGSVAGESTATKDHALKITGLTPGQTYHFRVQNLDDSGLVGYDRTAAYSGDYSFTTLNSPSVTEVEVTDMTLSSAVVNWKTASLDTSKVEYGLTTEYGSELIVSTNATESLHSGRLTNLEHSTKYHFRIRGTDVDGNDIISDDYVFETLTYPRVTAVVLNTDQGAGGTSVVLGWATNVATTGEVEYQGLVVNPESATQYDATGLAALSQAELARVSTIPKTAVQQAYSGKLELRHIMRLENLEDGAIYVFTIKGRDDHGNEVVGDPIRYVTGNDTRPPVISNVIIETPLSGVGSEAKVSVIVSWETDEPSIGQVLWGAGTGSEYSSATEKDQALTTKHVMVIRDLQPTASYHLKIQSSDKTGNLATTKDTVVVTPTSQQAAFDVILKNLEDVFGFLKL